MKEVKSQDIRGFCKPLDNPFAHSFNPKKHVGISLFKRMILFFIKAKYQTDEWARITTKYKIFRGKMYVLAEYPSHPKYFNCRRHIEPIKNIT